MKPYLLALFILLAVGNTAIAQHAAFNTAYKREVLSDQFFYLQTGDINGDGLTDVVASGNEILLWLQQPGGTLATPQRLFFNNQAVNTAMNMAISDLDKDGKNELLVLNYECLKIYKWQSGTLVLTDSIGGVGGAYRLEGLTTEDFDGDGYTDIAFPEPGDNRLVVMYYQSEAVTNWDIRRYDIGRDQGNCYLSSGMFGPLTQPAIIFEDSRWEDPVSVFTFGSNRQIKQSYDLDLQEPNSGFRGTHSHAVVHKGAGKPAELWVAYGGNTPNGKIAVWRGLQNKPDTTFVAGQIPEAIVSANLDCDEDDEPVVLHGGWTTASVYTDTAATYYYGLPYVTHYSTTGLSIGDVNNDGRPDACFITWPYELTIMYNITTPCWPTNVQAVSTVANSISVYPNPAADELNISCKGMGDVPIQLTDMTGRVVLRDVLKGNNAQLDVSTLATGQYILRIGNSSSMVSVMH